VKDLLNPDWQFHSVRLLSDAKKATSSDGKVAFSAWFELLILGLTFWLGYCVHHLLDSTQENAPP
jgi:hypothetical protein